MPKGVKGFQKGQSGNPSGRPKILAQVRDLARQHTDEAIKTLADMLKSDNDRTKVAAAEVLLDRGWGRPEQSINHRVIKSFDDLNDEELAALAALSEREGDATRH